MVCLLKCEADLYLHGIYTRLQTRLTGVKQLETKHNVSNFVGHMYLFYDYI